MTSKQRATYIFYREYGGSKNFMTPRILSRGMARPSLAWELSEGTGLENDPIFGVTFVLAVGQRTKRLSNICECFRSKTMARAHIEHYRR